MRDRTFARNEVAIRSDATSRYEHEFVAS